MATYTYVTTPEQETVLAAYLVVENARRARGGTLPPLTTATAIQETIENMIEKAVIIVVKTERDESKDAQTEAIRTLLETVLTRRTVP